jgi:hypothetical protein
MAAPDFPASPTVGQVYTAPSSGTVYKWDGAVWYTTGVPQGAYWTDTGTTLTPTDATKSVAIGDTTTHNALLLGSRTAKAHLITHPTSDAIYYAMNQGLNAAASAWVQDDVSKASWMLGMDSVTDQVNVFRGAAGGPQALLLTLDNAGNLKLPSNEDRLITMGAGTVKGYVGADASGGAKLSSNHPWAPTDNAKQGWMLDLSQTSDLASIFHKAPGTSTITTPLQIRGSDGKTVCTLADSSITRGMVAAGHGFRQVWTTPTAVNGSTSGANWTNFVNLSINTSGGLLMVRHEGFAAWSLSTSTITNVRQGVQYNGNWLRYYTMLVATPTGGGTVSMPSTMILWTPAAGAYTMSFWYQCDAGTIATRAEPGYSSVVELL